MSRAARILNEIQQGFRDNPVLESGDRRYHLSKDPIAKGGMGLVYSTTVEGNTAFPFRVYDRKKRMYVVEEQLTKAVLKIPFADQGFARAAIRTEREALERPAHPNVVRLLEVVPIPMGNGKTVDGLILERLVPSPPELLAKGPLEERTGSDLATSIEMVANLLKALNTIHFHKRIYLCDIKPLNVLLRVGWEAPNAQEGRFKEEYVRRLSNGELQWAFIDLGIAVPRQAIDTKGKSFIGSTEYSPPEAVLDFYLSERRDVYSLTASFAEMLTGKKPHLAALLEAKKRFMDGMDKARTDAEKQQMIASRGRLAFECVREDMKAGVPPFDMNTVLDHVRQLPECSQLEAPVLERLTKAIESFLTEGLHPDPKERATADRLFQILRQPFEISARATDSFLDDYFMLRFRQNVVPRASEVVESESEESFHYTKLPEKKFSNFFEINGRHAHFPPQPGSAFSPGAPAAHEAPPPPPEDDGFVDAMPATIAIQPEAPPELEPLEGFVDNVAGEATPPPTGRMARAPSGPQRRGPSGPIRRRPTNPGERPATARMPRRTGRMGPPPGPGGPPSGPPGSHGRPPSEAVRRSPSGQIPRPRRRPTEPQGAPPRGAGRPPSGRMPRRTGRLGPPPGPGGPPPGPPGGPPPGPGGPPPAPKKPTRRLPRRPQD